jgi:hypothetical protein
MKKIIFAFGALAFIAAGCQQSVSQNSTAGTSSDQVAIADQSGQQPEVDGARTKAQPKARVQFKNIDDIFKILEKDSANEQAKIKGSDDTDLLNSDSAALNSFTEVNTNVK